MALSKKARLMFFGPSPPARKLTYINFNLETRVVGPTASRARRSSARGRLPMVGAGPSGPMRRRDGLGEARDASHVVVKKRALGAGHGVAGAALVDARSPTDGRRRAFRSHASTRRARRGARRRGRRRETISRTSSPVGTTQATKATSTADFRARPSPRAPKF